MNPLEQYLDSVEVRKDLERTLKELKDEEMAAEKKAIAYLEDLELDSLTVKRGYRVDLTKDPQATIVKIDGSRESSYQRLKQTRWGRELVRDYVHPASLQKLVKEAMETEGKIPEEVKNLVEVKMEKRLRLRRQRQEKC